MTNLEPIKLVPARERIASVLRKQILSGGICEGEELTLESIASQLGVSNTPVREAFQILGSEGLIRLSHHKGAVVLSIDDKFIRDHFKTQAILEREAAWLVCHNNEDMSEIIRVFEETKEALKNGQYHNYNDYNFAFHNAIWTASNNKKLKSIVVSMWSGLTKGYSSTEMEYAQKSFEEHEDILKAMTARKADKARDLMEMHILRSMEDMVSHFSKNE